MIANRVLPSVEQPTLCGRTASLPGVLRHLARLTDHFDSRDGQVAYIHIYAEPGGPEPDAPLRFPVAQESGFEGIACVDDVARAAVLALQTYEHTGSYAALALAEEWLGFLAYMQEPDGRFTNFICDDTGRKNHIGLTSYTGGDWWTARALWALAMAWRVTGDSRYLTRFLLTPLLPSPRVKVLAIQTLALLELYQREPSALLSSQIRGRCDAIIESGHGYFRDAPNQASVSSWGYRQLQAVARAARLLDRPDYVVACAATVRNLIMPIVEGGFYHVYPHERDNQCAYDLSPLVLGLEELYLFTKAVNMRDLALTCAGWLHGNNHAAAPLYDPLTGRCADGIVQGKVSTNCGAESAIEAGFIHLADSRLRQAVVS